MIVIAARPAVGKALALDTPLPTPTGWTTMGEVRVGDHLIGADGKPTQVVAATEVMHGRPCYEVEFDDGEVIVADENHQWLTWDSPRLAVAGSPDSFRPRWSRPERLPVPCAATWRFADPTTPWRLRLPSSVRWPPCPFPLIP